MFTLHVLARWCARMALVVSAIALAGCGTATTPTPGTAATQPTTRVLTAHNDNARTGQNRAETHLTAATLHSFGKLAAQPVDGTVYTQPLYLAGLTLADGKPHNAVFVATEHDSVYAFDADTPNAAPLWCTSFISTATPPCTTAAGVGPNTTPVPATDAFEQYFDIRPAIGITGTPVIDPATNTLYVSAMTREGATQPYHYAHTLHALDSATGKERNTPAVIGGSVAGEGAGNVGGRITFDALRENQRPALLLANGIIYVGFAGYSDRCNYQGWLMAYRAADLAPVATLNTAPDGGTSGMSHSCGGAGIWMSGSGPATDSDGTIYITTGNGSFDLDSATPPSTDAGSSVLKLRLTNGAFERLDSFTPFNQECLDGRDIDFGSSAPLILPDQPGATPHTLLAIGKAGRLFVLDRDSGGTHHGLGGYTEDPALTACPNPTEEAKHLDKALQTVDAPNLGAVFGALAYWQDVMGAQYVYAGPSRVFASPQYPLTAMRIENGQVANPDQSHSAALLNFPGATPAVSSNGGRDGIVWIVASPTDCHGQTLTREGSAPNYLYKSCYPTSTGALVAYDATNLASVLYTSATAPADAPQGGYAKFSVPTIADGRVFFGTQNTLEIYGLKN